MPDCAGGGGGAAGGCAAWYGGGWRRQMRRKLECGRSLGEMCAAPLREVADSAWCARLLPAARSGHWHASGKWVLVICPASHRVLQVL